MEILSDIAIDVFFAEFNRFTARRVILYEIRSDCDNNYVLEARQLKALFKEEATQEILNFRTGRQWKFNPPTSDINIYIYLLLQCIICLTRTRKTFGNTE